MEKRVIRRQIERYGKFNKIRFYCAKLGSVEKNTTTVYVKDGDIENVAFKADIKTGKILRPKFCSEIMRCNQISIARAKKNIKEIILSNEWRFFITLTFNNEMQDRLDDTQTRKSYDNFRRYLKRNFSDMYYLSIPERHKKGGIHFHILIGSITAEELKLVDSGKKTKSGKTIYNVGAWKYGFSTATEVESQERTATYIMKYIGKDLGGAKEFSKKYWASKNCARCDIEVDDIDLARLDEGGKKTRFNHNDVNILNYSENEMEIDLFTAIEYYDPAKNYIVYFDRIAERQYKKYHKIN